jgi:GNAT superfamily N-acetyltransferase
MAAPAQHTIQQYSLDRGSLEIEYMEQYFPEFRDKKSAREILHRLRGREHLILISLAPLPDERETLIPVAFKVGHELRAVERDLQLMDLVSHISDCMDLTRKRIFYSWIGGTRKEWRGRGHYRALTEQQEEWAHRNAYDEMLVKTKNKFYAMRATLDHLHFNVLKFERNAFDTRESKVYMHKTLTGEVIAEHLTHRVVMEAA